MGVVGLLGLVLAVMKREPGRSFAVGSTIASIALLTQVGMGLWVYVDQDAEWAGNQHVFYGIVILFTFSFAYIYRAQLAKRAALSYGLLGLFMMGLGIRGIQNFGQSFGG
jgi:heme A synthase